MALALTHFMLGFVWGYWMSQQFSDTNQYTIAFSLIAGGFALIPDINKLYAHPVLDTFHQSLLANVFVFHQLLDVADPTDSIGLAVYILALVMMQIVGHQMLVYIGRIE